MLGTRNDTVVAVPPTLQARDVDHLVTEIQRTAGPGRSVKLDCSAFSQVGSAQVASLCQLVHRCAEEKLVARLGPVTPSLERVLKVLDLHELLINGEAPEPQAELNRAQIAPVLSQQRFQESFGPSLEEWEATMNRFRSFIGSTGVAEVEACELEIVFYEIVTNIRFHAGLSASEKITCELTIDSGLARLHFTDPGKPFDPTQQLSNYRPVEFVRSGSTRGLGLTMVRRMVNNMSYRREHGSLNVLTLEKRLRDNNPLGDVRVPRQHGNTVIINAGATLDMDNAQEMMEALAGAKEGGSKFAIIDMAKLDRISSAGAGAILGYVSQFRQNGGDIVLCNVSGNVRHVLDVLDLTDYLTLKNDVTKAQEYCETFK